MTDHRSLRGQKIVIATHNAGKRAEFADLLAPYGVETVSAADLGLDAPEETEKTFEGNARLKSRYAARESGLIALADDSGIEIDGLDGAPGVYTADWAEGPGGRDYVRAMTRSHDELVARGAPQPWTARFVCLLSVDWPDGDFVQFRGEAPGRLAWPMRGDAGHGYDPIFVPDGYDQTFGEMPPALKNRLSHRAVALAKLREALL